MDTSYLTTQVSTIVGQLHGLFDEIGVPSHDRETRESEVIGRYLIFKMFALLMTIIALYCTIRDTTQSIAARHCVISTLIGSCAKF